MERTGLQQSGDLYLQDGFWRLRWSEGAMDRKPSWIGPATGPERLTREQAERIARENFLSRTDLDARTPQSGMTIADFVETVFVPEHVATKKLAGRTHYQAILKHVLTPEEVDRIFQVDREKRKAKLKAVPNWPYLSDVRLCDARPDHVQGLISAALAHRYSTQTVTHIRNVVSAIFEHARKKQWLTGDNPAGAVMLPGMTRKEAHTLTLAQANQVLGAMQYPEKEMTLIAILTTMSMAEICGLQWKCVNLTGAWSLTDGEPIAPRTIAIRRQWYRSELALVNRGSRKRNLPIPEALLPVLLGLSQRGEFTGPDDFVLAARGGTPIDEKGIGARRLKRIGKDLQMPWLSWHVFHRTHATLAQELGLQSLERMATVGYSDAA
jgi:integrase